MPRARIRVRLGELLSLLGALALLVDMFAMEWYGVASAPDPSAARPALPGSEDAWTGLAVIRWVLLATIVTVLGSVALHASQRRHGNRTRTGPLVAILGTLSSAALAWRVLIALPDPGRVIDQKLGAVLGLAAALTIAWGGVEAAREERLRRAHLAHRPVAAGEPQTAAAGAGPRDAAAPPSA